MRLTVPDAVTAILRAEAERHYPRECCGLLIGTAEPGDVRVRRCIPARNVAPADRPDRFEVDPQTLIDVYRDVRAAGEAVVGHYHSHPDAPPEPSDTDAAWITDPTQVWVIQSVTAAGAGETRAWRPSGAGRGAAFLPLEIRYSGA